MVRKLLPATGKGTRRERMLGEGTLRYTEVSEGSGVGSESGDGIRWWWCGRNMGRKVWRGGPPETAWMQGSPERMGLPIPVVIN